MSQMTSAQTSAGQASATQTNATASLTDQQTGNGTVVSDGTATGKTTTKLPQTSEQSTSVWSALGLGMMSILSLFGLAKRKKHDND